MKYLELKTVSVYNNDHISNRRLTWALRFLRKYLGIEGTTSCLDLGCGSGEYFPILIEMGMNITGVDVLPPPNDSNANQLSNFIQADLEHLTLQKETFDSIICLSTLEHLNNPEKTVEQIFTALNEGGIAVFNVPWLWEIKSYPTRAIFHRFLDNIRNGHPGLLAKVVFSHTGTPDKLRFRWWVSLFIWPSWQIKSLEDYSKAHLKGEIAYIDFNVFWLWEIWHPHKAILYFTLGSLQRGKPNLISRLFFTNTDTPDKIRWRRKAFLFVWGKEKRRRTEKYIRSQLNGSAIHTDHKHWFTPTEFIDLLQKNGGTLLDYSGSYIVPPGIAYIPGALKLLYWIEDTLPRTVTKWLGQSFVVAAIKSKPCREST